MPFKSQAQAGYMHEHPEILGKSALSEWDAATKGKSLPKYADTHKKRKSGEKASYHDTHVARTVARVSK